MRSIAMLVVLLGCLAPGCSNGLGSDCDSDLECESGHCSVDDRVCCDTPCDATCYSCNLPGREGMCWPIPDGEDDDEAGFSLGSRCGWYSTCRSQSCVPEGRRFFGDAEDPRRNGTRCNASDECISAACAFGMCRKRNQAPCEAADECASNHCDDFTCVPCFLGNYCPARAECNMDPLSPTFGLCAEGPTAR